MEFLEAPAFTRYVSSYLSDDEHRKLQNRLAAAPELGDVMPGTRGFRKLRWADPRRGKGRRGGLRVIYYYFPREQQIWLMTLYDKDEASDLTTEEKQTLKAPLKLNFGLVRLQDKGKCGGKSDEKEKDFRRTNGRYRRDEKTSRGENYASHL